jgi:hypothetical protein
VGKREREFLCNELLHVWTAEVRSLLNLDDLEDLWESISIDMYSSLWAVRTYVDRPKAGTMPCGHVLVEGLDGIRPGQLTVLFVHVVGAGTGIVTDPDAKVLNLLGALLVDLDIMH